MDAPAFFSASAFHPVQQTASLANTGMPPVQQPSSRVIPRMAPTRDGSAPPEGHPR